MLNAQNVLIYTKICEILKKHQQLQNLFSIFELQMADKVFLNPFRRQISRRYWPIDLKTSHSRIKSANPVSYNVIKINSVNYLIKTILG